MYKTHLWIKDQNSVKNLWTAICLNTWSLLGATVLEGLGGVAFLEEVHHWEWVLKFQNAFAIPNCVLRCKLSAVST